MDKSIFGPHFKELLIIRSLQIFRSFLTIIFMLRISSKRLKFLMIISPNNAKFMIMVVLPDFISRTDKSISHFDANTDQIVDIIQKYSTKKVQSCDEISVAMLQLCATEVALPLSLIFQKCLLTRTFPDLWKRANVQPIQTYFTFNYLWQNIRTIIFDQVYSFLDENKLISKNQSGFRPGDSTIYQ